MRGRYVAPLALLAAFTVAGFAVAADPTIAAGLAVVAIVAAGMLRPSWLKWVICALVLVPTASFLRGTSAETSAIQLAGSIESGSVENSLSATLLFLIGLTFVYRNRRNMRDVNLVPCLASFIVLVYASTIWSQSASLTLRRSTEALFITVFALGIGSFYYARRPQGHVEVIRVICGAASIMVFAVFLVEVVRGSLHLLDPSWRLGHEGIENQLGWMSAVGFLLAWITRRRSDIWTNRWVFRFHVVVPALGVLLTKSRETWLGVLTALIVVQIVKPNSFGKKVRGLTAVACLVGVFALVPALNLLMWNRGSSEQDLVTASGRTDLWQAAIPLINDHLLFGYGYGAFWTPQTIMRFSTDWSPTSLHNGYLETTAEVGIAGLFLVALGIVVSARNAWWLTQESEHAEIGLGLIAVLVCFASTDLFGGILEVFNYFHVTAILTFSFFVSYRRYLVDAKPSIQNSISVLTEA